MTEAQRQPTEPGDRLLTSLAILKANWDQGQRSYLDNFLPFIADCLNLSHKAEVAPGELSLAVRERFGIPLPEGVVQTLLKRAARLGLGTREQGRFRINKVEVAKFDLTRQRSDAMRREEALVERLMHFCRNRHEFEVERPVAEAALLKHLEKHSTSILRASLRGAAYQPELEDEPLEYVISDFIVHTFARDPEGFDYLEAVVKGLMLVSVVYLPAPAEVGRRFERTTLLFDTRLLLQALGYEGPEAESSMRQTLELAYELGATLAAFSHTVVETQSVLSGIANSMQRFDRSDHRRLTEQWFRKQGYSASDVELLADNVEEDLKGLRIAIVERPDPMVSLTVDEEALETTLQERIHYQSRTPLLHDLDALTAVHRLRNGRRQSQLERCRALFVTTNNPLIGVARQFFHGGDPQAVPIALADDDLSTLVWLKRPLDAPDLPRLRIIADCYAALEPGNELWGKYLDEADRLRVRGSITQNDYFILRYSLDAKQALMDRTFGVSERLTPEMVEEVLGRARDAIKQPEERRAREAEASSSAAETSAAEAAARAEVAEARAAAAEAKALTAARLIDKQRRKARNHGELRGRLARRTSLVVLIGMAAVVAYFSLPSSLGLPPADLSGIVRWILRVIFVAAVVVLLICQTTGHSFVSLARRAEVVVSRRSESRMLEKLGLSDDVGGVDGT